MGRKALAAARRWSPSRARLLQRRRVASPPLAAVSDLARLRMLSRIAEQVGEGVAVSDNDGWFLYVNPTFAAQHASTPEELTGAHLSSFHREEDLAAVQPVISAALEHGTGRGDVTRLRRDGTTFPGRITLSLLHDESGDLIGREICVQDVTDHRLMEEQMRQAALHHPLTGLPNRRLLRDRIEHALAVDSRRRRGTAAVFVDVDGFKQVNDGLGHAVGDEVLVQVARRLDTVVRATRWPATAGTSSSSCSRTSATATWPPRSAGIRRVSGP